MKYLVYLLCIISWSCQGQVTPAAQTARQLITKTQLHQQLAFLTSDSLQGRQFGTPQIDQAADYIATYFKHYNIKAFQGNYKHPFSFHGKTGYNILAYIPGTDTKLKNEYILLGAHYDHIGITSPVAGDSIANGANDDASGTVAVLALARYFAKHPPKRSLIFALFSAEEEGLIGSSRLADQFKADHVPITAVLTFEMIGVPLKDKSYQAYLTGYKKSTLAQLFNAGTKAKTLGFWPFAQHHHLFKRSDNYPFYAALNVPAHTISTFSFDNFNYYHRPGDELATLNIDFMQQLILNCIPGIEAIANAKPQEIHLKS